MKKDNKDDQVKAEFITSDSSPPSTPLVGLASLASLYDPSVFPDLYARPFPSLIDTETLHTLRQLRDDVERLRSEIDEQAVKVQRAKFGAEEKEQAIRDLEEKVKQLTNQERLSFLLTRVNSTAQAKLLASEEFQASFSESGERSAYVMSVDIRRSTDLMLKARAPQQFANFITTLCRDLEDIVKEHYGVFDKFTGDGVLSFFPEFFSGEDAGYWVIRAASRCHVAFQNRYREFRGSFTTVLMDVGLGIGIDYGPTHLVQMAGGLTVVGAPVVYACRMSAAPAGRTLLNQPAYEKIVEKFSPYCFLREEQLDVKHEGSTLAYAVDLNENEFSPRKPDWTENAR